MAKLLGSLPVGALVKDTGTIYYGKPIIWRITDKNHEGYPANSVTLITENIITLKCFDAKEASNVNTNRRNYGNNRYIYANLRKWLNSESAAGAWYTAQHSADAPPSSVNVWSDFNEYDTQAGFLNEFSDKFKAALLLTTLTVAKNTVTDDGGSETCTDKIFLASNTEVGLANENHIVEGVLLALFNNDTSRAATPTAECVANNEHTNSGIKMGTGWYWWLRTPLSSSSHSARDIGGSGTLNSDGAYNGSNAGVRPLCNLPSEILVSDSVDADGAYTIIAWKGNLPAISGSDANLGILSAAFLPQHYTVNQENSGIEGSVTVTEKLDNTTLRSYTATSGAANTFSLDDDTWRKVLNGSHTATIEAENELGLSATRTLTFTKNEDVVELAIDPAFPADDMPTRCVISATGAFPEGSILTVEACNNGFDTVPAWEDVTAKVLKGDKYIFANTQKTAAKWGLGIRTKLERRTAVGDCYIYSLGGNFD